MIPNWCRATVIHGRRESIQTQKTFCGCISIVAVLGDLSSSLSNRQFEKTCRPQRHLLERETSSRDTDSLETQIIDSVGLKRTFSGLGSYWN